MNKKYTMAIILGVVIGISGCGYGYYLGFHGPSIKSFPDIHEGITEDSDCLGCHGPEDGSDDAPKTTHPAFTGCLDCHNDSPS